jgi:hypothetical protein
MFGLDKKIRSAAATGGAVALAGALAVLGVVWLSIAAVSALAEFVTPIVAMCIVGVAAMTPLAVVLIRKGSARPASTPEPVVQTAEDVAAVMRLAQSAQLMAERAPVAGIALTLGAAFIAARSPTTSPLAVHMLAEAVERWLNARAHKDAEEQAASSANGQADAR